MTDPASGARVGADAGLRSATVWSYSLALGKQGITLGLSFVLAGMLGPQAFGVIAMALVFTNLITMLQQQGLMPAIISRKELTDLHKDTAFLLVVGGGLVLTAAGIAVAPLWAALNHLPELTHVIQVLALGIPLSSSVVVHEAILRRNLAFKQLAIRSWTSVLAGGIAGVIGALLGWDVWALVAQQLATVATEVVVLWRVSPWRPRFRWSSVAARQLWRYSVRSGSSSIGLFLSSRMDIVVGGAFFGPAVIGVYRMGQRLTQMVLDVTAQGMQSVSLPGLSVVQDDHPDFARRFLSMQRQQACLALPLLGLLAGLAPCIERILGPAWHGTTTAIMLLAVVQALRSVTMLHGPALQARNRPGTLSLVIWLFAVLYASALVTASLLAVDGDDLTVLCVAMIIASTIGSTVMIMVGSRSLHISLRALTATWVPGAVAGVVGGATTFLVYRAAEGLPWVVAGAMAGVAGLIVAAATVLLLAPTIKARFLAALRRGRPAAARPEPTTIGTGSLGDAETPDDTADKAG